MADTEEDIKLGIKKVPDVVAAYNRLAEFALFIPNEGWISSDGKVVCKTSTEYAIKHNLFLNGRQ